MTPLDTTDRAELDIARRQRAPDDLPLFAQRLASPEASAGKPTAHFPGPATHARAEAKVKADRSLTGRRGRILRSLTAYGPQTRLTLTRTTGLEENSVNSATNALLKAGKVHLLPALDPETGRSIVALTEEAP